MKTKEQIEERIDYLIGVHKYNNTSILETLNKNWDIKARGGLRDMYDGHYEGLVRIGILKELKEYINE
jgi:hypothetical protein